MEFTILLSQSSKYWSYRHVPLCLVIAIPAILCDLNLNSPDNSNVEEFFKDFLAKEIFFFSFLLCLYLWCVCLHGCMFARVLSIYLCTYVVFVCVCVCTRSCLPMFMHMWRLKLDLRSLPQSLFAFFLEEGSLS